MLWIIARTVGRSTATAVGIADVDMSQLFFFADSLLTRNTRTENVGSSGIHTEGEFFIFIF